MTEPTDYTHNENNMLQPPIEPHRQTAYVAGSDAAQVARWDDTWMAMAHSIAKRSRCVRDQVGCVLVSVDNQIVSTGLNGPPKNYQPSEELINNVRNSGINDVTTLCSQWCPRSQKSPDELDSMYRDCCANHSEINAIARADYSRLVDGTAYVTSSICLHCAKALAALRIKRVVAVNNGDSNPHRNADTTRWFLEKCGIMFDEINFVAQT